MNILFHREVKGYTKDKTKNEIVLTKLFTVVSKFQDEY